MGHFSPNDDMMKHPLIKMHSIEVLTNENKGR